MTTYRTEISNVKDQPRTSVNIFPATKGLQSAIPAALIQHEWLNQSRNLIHTTNGSRRTRPGIEPYYVSGFGSGDAVKCLIDFWRNVSGVKTQKVVAITSGKIFSDAADGVFSSITTVGDEFSASAKISMDALVGFLVIGVSGEVPRKYLMSGAVTDLGGSPPTAWIVRKHRSSIFLAGDANNPDVLYKSGLEAPEIWSGGTSDTFNVDLGSSDPVGLTALSPTLYGRMYIGKWNSIYSLNTYNGIQAIEPISETIGIVSHNAVVATHNDLIFPSVRGIHSLQTTQTYGDVENTFITFPVHDIWTQTVNFDRSQEMSAAFIPEYNSYLITYPKRGSETFDVLGYNIVTGDIFHWSDFGASFLTTFRDSQRRTRLLIGTQDANIGLGRLMTDVDFSDFMESFSSGFKTGNIFPTYQPNSVWSFKNLTVFFKPRSGRPMVVTYFIDNKEIGTLNISQTSSGGTLLKDFILAENSLGAANNYTAVKKELNGYGNSIQLDFNVEPPGEDLPVGMEVYGYEIDCEQVGSTFVPISTG